MLNKTIHRIEAGQVVIEDDRRKEQLFPYPNVAPEVPRRTPEHDYSQKHKFFYVPVEPQPLWEEEPTFSKGKEYDAWYGRCHTSGLNIEVYEETCPFRPDDTLILLEEWLSNKLLADKLVTSNLDPEAERFLRVNNLIQPAIIMPPELDSKCQQYNVVKVLGVEERGCRIKPNGPQGGGGRVVSLKPWHWKLLANKA